jgi:large subunit ribosomal protein L23
MKSRDIRMVIEKPVVTEKSTGLKEGLNRYVFQVDVRANKNQIKKAVEELFGVKVKDVRTAVYRGKHVVVMNRRGRFEGYRSNWKKAFVTLAEGDSIDLFDVV